MVDEILDKKFSAMGAENIVYLERLYMDYVRGECIDKHWESYFDALGLDKGADFNYRSAEQIGAVFKSSAKMTSIVAADENYYAVDKLVHAYRCYGHYHCGIGYIDKINTMASLDLESFGLASNQQLSRHFLYAGQSYSSVKLLEDALQQTYTGSIGYEFMHIDTEAERLWLQENIEQPRGSLSDTERINTLTELVRAEVFEQYLGRKFVGQKRFSLEGGEVFIPLVERLLSTSVTHGCSDVVIGMAHRGRLNVLMNVMGMPSSDIEDKFHGSRNDTGLSGDVKYHLGYSVDRLVGGKKVHVMLGFNPSHLEIIGPVVMGSVRARLDHANYLAQSGNALALLVHGDAALAGQGVVSESLNLGYTQSNNIDGSIHVVINNQIGFTTEPKDSRSSIYCTDIAKLVQAPVIHVDADDVDAVMHAIDLACAYKYAFKKDVFIDLVCFRRHGHNESDEPAATQPLRYRQIDKHPGVATVFANKLVAEGVVDAGFLENERTNVLSLIKQGASLVDIIKDSVSWRQRHWCAYQDADWRSSYTSELSLDRLQRLGTELLTLPEGFVLQKQVGLLHEARRAMMAGDKPLNWGCAEMLAYATLLEDGYPIRLTGQDSCRGTFAHRHAVYVDNVNGEHWCALRECNLYRTPFYIFNSVLSESAALAYEYGYAEASPKTLVIWEAQFGDFANNAQVVIDQFLASAWQKWQRMSGLVLLLPHGYEGQGPEHSSARLERFLQLCAQENMQVCVPTTPAQYFHMIRRQMLRSYRRPLVVMSPKSLLRNPQAVSSLDELVDGSFKVLIGDASSDCALAKRLVLCAGKIYYELCALRDEEQLMDVHIVRLEQLYPFPYDELRAHLAAYRHISKVIWVQEEPHNQGAWYTIFHRLGRCLDASQRLCYAGRPKMAAPAAGDFHQYKQAQRLLLEQALGLTPNDEE